MDRPQLEPVEARNAAGRYRHGTHEIDLDGYAYRWYRVGGVDETLIRETY